MVQGGHATRLSRLPKLVVAHCEHTPMKPNGIVSPETRLLETAIELFCREGIHATGITAIINQAQVARRTLYERYGSKENLLRAVFKREGQRWFTWFDTTLPALSTQPQTQLLGLFDLLRDWFDSDEFYGCIFINAAAEHHKEASWVVTLAQAHLNEIRGRILSLVERAGLEEADSIADELSLLVDGAIVTAMMSRDPAGALTARRIAQQILRPDR